MRTACATPPRDPRRMTVPQPAATSPSADAAPTHAPAGTPCVGCGYIVGGMAVDAICPECTTSVRASVRGDVLTHANADYLATLVRGMTFVIVGTSLSLAWWAFAPIFLAVLPAARMITQEHGFLLLTAVDFLAAIVLLLGWWQVTAVNPAVQDVSRDSTLRRVLRWILVVIAFIAASGFMGAVVPAFAQAGMAGVSGSVTINSSSQLTPLLLAALALRVLHLVARMARYVLGLQYLSSLLLRVPDPVVAKSVRRQTWLLPVWLTLGWAVVIGPLIGPVWYIVDLVRARSSLSRVAAARRAMSEA